MKAAGKQPVFSDLLNSRARKVTVVYTCLSRSRQEPGPTVSGLVECWANKLLNLRLLASTCTWHQAAAL